VKQPATVAKNISSKQNGDEFCNGIAAEKGITAKAKRKRDKDNDGGDPLNITSNAYDASRTWPLFCFELRFSVDQEERFLATHKQVRSTASGNDMPVGGKIIDTLSNHRSQMAAAVSTAESLNKAVGSLSHVISRREDRTLARILNPQQLLAYQTWLNNSANRDRCCNKVTEGHLQKGPLQPASEQNASCTPMDSEIEIGSSSKEASLHDICRRLNQVLRISQR
jgi:hypothetical protein